MKNFYSDVEKMMQNKYKEDNRDYLKLLQAGNTAQIEKLRENDHKRGFDNVDTWYAYTRIREELLELEIEVMEQDFNKMRKEAADIANFAHMIIFKCDQELKG